MSKYTRRSFFRLLKASLFGWDYPFKTPKMKFEFSFKKYLGYYVSLDNINKYLMLETYGILWKDKYGTPRFELSPMICLTILKRISFRIRLIAPKVPQKQEDFYSDDYFEQLLWFTNYSEKNLRKAILTWPWRKTVTNEIIMKEGSIDVPPSKQRKEYRISSWDNSWIDDKYKHIASYLKHYKDQEIIQDKEEQES